jgi:hypothetical protein
MGKTVFIPLTDDLLYDHPERILGPVIPFSQQARSAGVGAMAFGPTIPSLDSEMKLEMTGSNPTESFKTGTTPRPQGGGSALG